MRKRSCILRTSRERATLEQFLADIPHFQAREDLSDKVKKLILRDNCIDFYSLRI